MGEAEMFWWRGRCAQWVEVCLQVPAAAMGADQAQHLTLFGAVKNLHPLGGRGLAQQGGGRASAFSGAQSEALKECTPSGVDRVGILQPVPIGSLNEIGVGISRQGK